jgi:hypothetical protein
LLIYQASAVISMQMTDRDRATDSSSTSRRGRETGHRAIAALDEDDGGGGVRRSAEKPPCRSAPTTDDDWT